MSINFAIGNFAIDFFSPQMANSWNGNKSKKTPISGQNRKLWSVGMFGDPFWIINFDILLKKIYSHFSCNLIGVCFFVFYSIYLQLTPRIWKFALIACVIIVICTELSNAESKSIRKIVILMLFLVKSCFICGHLVNIAINSAKATTPKTDNKQPTEKD